MNEVASFILQELQLYNWGAFSGRHVASIDAGNSAIIGATGSGKTTLVDALMTLLCARPRYNLASTGGHESDRDLVSYVRGASGQGNDSGDHIARSGPCVTGAAARLVRGAETVWLGALLWFDGSSQSAADMHKRWFFAQGESHGLQVWLEAQHSGGARSLTRLTKEVEGLQMFSSKEPYLAKLHSFFEVGANAFTLLNRAAGLKQLNSIDDIFRELVLDEQSAFDDAKNAIDGFAELQAMHAELEKANAQYLSLLPLRDMNEREQMAAQHAVQLQVLLQQLPGWFAAQGAQWWQQRAVQLQAQMTQRAQAVDAAQSAVAMVRLHEQDLHAKYLQVGGADIATLEEVARLTQLELARKQAKLADYKKLASNLGLHADAQAADLTEHQALAKAALAQLDVEKLALQAQAESAITDERNAHAQLQQLQTELALVRQRPDSNLPGDFQRFRADLAAALQLGEDDLPYVAELVEVHKTQQLWRGAIERAIGSHRLRILVPSDAMRAALDWVNQRHNRLHVRLQEARSDSKPAVFWSDGFACKLTLKSHAHLQTLRRLLADVDRHCVADVASLQRTPHAMTAQGLMSGKADQFDKQDQKRLDQDWMTGFDNRDRLTQLVQAQAQADAQWRERERSKAAVLEAQGQLQASQSSWGLLMALQPDDVAVASAQAQQLRVQQQLRDLLDPQSDAAQAKQHWQQAQVQARACESALRELESAQTQDTTLLAQAQHRSTEQLARSDSASPAADVVERLMQVTGKAMPSLDGENLDAQEREQVQTVQLKLKDAERKLAELHKDIIRQMGKASEANKGELADVVQEVEALPQYLARLQTLETEALPSKRESFQQYLNGTSQQSVDALLSGINEQVVGIQSRIERLNATLQRVDFQPGRYLQLEPREVVHQSLQHMNRAQAALRTERLRDDGGESHYRALRALIDMLQTHVSNPRSKPALALLDARHRLQFAVLVLDRSTGQLLERRTGSQGGSGGEKEIISSYVLTASLSYALCPEGATRPVFGSIVLDEAFSKSSQAVAARIIQALREFGLHALFVTPNKEVRLLREHTRSAVVVHRKPSGQAMLVSLSWQELMQARDAQVLR